MKKYTLVKNLSISMIIISISISWLAFTIIADAPLGGAGIAIVLTFLSLILNFIIIYGNLSVEIGKLTEGFEKNRLQKITGNLIPFLVGNALVFYVVYKFVWAVFPNVVHGMGDSPIGVYIGIVGFPLIYSVFPLYYMGEKIINGYLVNKYYDQFKAEYDLKD